MWLFETLLNQSAFVELAQYLFGSAVGLIGKDGVKAAEDYKDKLENLSTAWDAFISKTGLIDGMTRAFARLEATLAKLGKGGIQDFAENIVVAAGSLRGFGR